MRDQLLDLVERGRRGSPCSATALARRHVDDADARPDLPAASAAVDVRSLRAVVRLPCRARCDAGCSTSSDDLNRSPAGAGCVNGTRLLDDRDVSSRRARVRRGHRAHPRCDVADRRSDPRARDARPACCRRRANLPRISRSGRAASSTSSTSPTATPDRASSCRRSATPTRWPSCAVRQGVLIGRLTGFLAVAKSPSARSDNLIFAYGEVPRALDLSIRVTRLMTGVVGTLHVNADRMARRARRRLHPGDRSHRVHRADVQRRLSQRVRRRRVGGPRSQQRRGIAGRHITGSDARRGSDRRDRERLGLAATDLEPSARPARDHRDASRDGWCSAEQLSSPCSRNAKRRPTTSGRRSSNDELRWIGRSGSCSSRPGSPPSRRRKS